MKLLKIITLCCVLIPFSCNQPKVEKAAQAELDAAFKAKYPDVQKVSWYKDDNGNYEAQFKENGQKFRADFSPTAAWLETENSIKFKDLPTSVQEAIKRDYDEDDIEEIEQVDSAKKGIFYDVEFDPKGEKKFDIEYNGLGDVIGREDK